MLQYIMLVYILLAEDVDGTTSAETRQVWHHYQISKRIITSPYYQNHKLKLNEIIWGKTPFYFGNIHVVPRVEQVSTARSGRICIG